MQNKNSTGFTLLELLAVLAIISIIALIAYPSYVNYVYKSNRLDAINSLFHYQALWQRCLLHQVDGLSCLQEIKLAPSQTLASLEGHYQISAKIEGPLVTFAAIPMQAQRSDKPCAQFFIDNTGGYVSYTIDGLTSTSQCW